MDTEQKEDEEFEKRMFAPFEVAQILKIHPQTVRKWINEGKIQPSKFNTHWRVTGESITEFVKANEYKHQE
jgi:excisionase family DNA binding protein